MIRARYIKADLIRPCVPTPLVKVGSVWTVGVPLYDGEGRQDGYATRPL